MLGVDGVSRITPYEARVLKGNYVEFINRYIMPSSSNSWKALTRQELKDILSAGLRLGFIFERTEGRPKGGFDAGVEDAKMARVALQELGVSERVCVYFCSDFQAVLSSDPVKSDMDEIQAYIEGAKSIMYPDYKVGMYGDFDVVESVSADYLWQTLAWSGGRVSTKIALYQKTAPVDFAGINVDMNDSFGDAQGLLMLVDNERMVDEDMGRIADLEARIAALEANSRIPCPDWARASADKAFAKGILKPEADGHVYGDVTFWRTIVLDDRNGEFDK